MKFLFFALLPIFWVAQTYAINTVVSGKSSPASDTLKLIVDNNYLTDDANGLIVIPSETGEFKFEVDINRNTIAHIISRDFSVTILVYPGENIDLQINNNAIESISSGKNAAADNRLFVDFFGKYKSDFDLSEIMPNLENASIDNLEIYAYSKMIEEKEFVKNNTSKNGASVFVKEFLNNEIVFNYYKLLFTYPFHEKGLYANYPVTALPDIMIKSVQNINFSDESLLIHPSFRTLLQYYITYNTLKDNEFNHFESDQVFLMSRYYYIENNFEGAVRQYALMWLLNNSIDKIDKDTFNKFRFEIVSSSESKLYSKYLEKLADNTTFKKIEKVENKPDNTKPDKKEPKNSNGKTLEITGLDGKKVKLSDFKGKAIYIDIWASWCGPCRQQFPYAEELKSKLTKEQKNKIVFLYISIDNTEDVWKKAINDIGMEGVHTISPGGWNSSVVKYFGIQSIPRYILVDTKGNVVDDNAKRPGNEGIMNDLLNLIK